MNLSQTSNSLDYSGIWVLISGATKIFSRYIHFLWASIHCSTISMINWISWDNFSALLLIGLIYRLARVLFTFAKLSSKMIVNSSTCPRTYPSLYGLIAISDSNKVFSTCPNVYFKFLYCKALVDISINSADFDSICKPNNFYRVSSSSWALKLVFKIPLIYRICSSYRNGDFRELNAGSDSLYLRTISFSLGTIGF